MIIVGFVAPVHCIPISDQRIGKSVSSRCTSKTFGDCLTWEQEVVKPTEEHPCVLLVPQESKTDIERRLL